MSTLRPNPPARAHVGDVARRFLLLFAPASLVLATIVAGVYYANVRAERSLIESAERNDVELQAKTIVDDFRQVISDLLVLAESPLLERYLAGRAPNDREALAGVYALLARHKLVYDQVRLISADGDELIRVNMVSGSPRVVPPEQLQKKFDRYYVAQTLRLDRGQVFVTPFDLNVENGQIEQPPKPTIRFCTPVFDAAGQRLGLVVLNYLGDRLVARLERFSTTAAGQLMLLNAQGYYLRGPNREDEFAFMFPDRVGQTFAAKYPSAWEEIRDHKAGQTTTPAGLFTFVTVHPALEPMPPAASGVQGGEVSGGTSPGDDAWKIVSFVSPGMLEARSANLLVGLGQMYGALIVVVAVASYWGARVLADRRQASEALRESEARFRQIAENINEVFYMTSADRREMIYISPAYESIWGRTCQSLRERPLDWAEAIHPEDRARVQREIFAQQPPAGHNVQYRILRPDGETRWIWDRSVILRDERGQVHRIVGVAEDTTPLRQAQQQALQSERLAAIGEAMAGLAHESRNALQRSQACLEMLGKRVKDRPEAIDLIDRLQHAQDHLHRLYEEVRNYAAPIQLRRQECDLGEALANAWSQLAAVQNGRAPQLHEQRASLDLSCQADPFAIGQCFRNILDNAVCDEHDGPAARRRPEVSVSWFESELGGQPALGVSIRDNGPGLTAEQARNIFEPFYTTKTKGTGLGMAITRRIVAAHGGEIGVGPANGQGAEIVIKLPRRSP
jgi:PAS domain S-box-containing protein